MSIRQRQDLCLIGDEGHLYMYVFDEMPRPVRERLRQSPFNLCCACLCDLSQFGTPTVAGVAHMEDLIRQGFTVDRGDHPIGEAAQS